MMIAAGLAAGVPALAAAQAPMARADCTNAAAPADAGAGPCATVADAAAPTPGPAQPPALPADVETLITLGNAGLLQSLLSLERVSLTQTRVGEARASLGYALFTGVRTGETYKDRALVVPIGAMKSVPIAGDGALFVRGAFAASYGTGDKTSQWNEGTVVRSDVQLLYAPDRNTMVGIGLIHQNVDIDNYFTSTNIPGYSDRQSWGARLDAAKMLSPNWGATLRAQFTKGDNDIGVPSLRYTHAMNSEEYYAQAEIVGHFSHADAKWIPEGLTLYPIVGANFFYGDYEQTADSYGFVYGSAIGPAEQYGTIWGEIRLEKSAQLTPNPQLLPYASIGIEREFRNNLDALVSEPTYGRGSVGLATVIGGNRIDLVYNNYFGTLGRRNIQSLTIATTLQF